MSRGREAKFIRQHSTNTLSIHIPSDITPATILRPGVRPVALKCVILALCVQLSNSMKLRTRWRRWALRCSPVLFTQ